VKVSWDGEPVVELHFKTGGGNGEYVWIEAVLESGKKVCTYMLKGTV